MKVCFKCSFKIMLLVFLVTMFIPTISFAAGDVFDTIQAKMISTVKDVRKIVYIIAGFGLVMFAFLAIFNKISFKHLSYIMISLTILALMMPFIEYFSGYTMEDNELNYDNFLREDDTSITGSDASNTTNCPPGKCPEDDIKLQNPYSNTDPLAPEAPDIIVPRGDLYGDGLATGAEQKMTFKDFMNSAISGTQDFINAANNAIDMVEAGKGVVNGVIMGATAIGDVLSGDGNFLDKIIGLSTAVSSSAANIGSNLNGVLGEGMNVSNYFGLTGLSDLLSDAKGGVANGVGGVQGWAGMGSSVGALGKDLGRLGGRLGLGK